MGKKRNDPLLRKTIPVVKEIEKRMAEGQEWYESSQNEQVETQFTTHLEAFRKATTERDADAGYVEPFDFYELIDPAIPRLRAVQGQSQQRRAEVFLETVLTPLSHAVREWPCIARNRSGQLKGAEERSLATDLACQKGNRHVPARMP